MLKCNFDESHPQVMLNGLANTWPARQKWTTDQLLQNYGDVAFKISQRSSKKISMKFKDYVSYMEVQHDEDPLYIFDEKVLALRYSRFNNALPCLPTLLLSVFLVFKFEILEVHLTFNLTNSLANVPLAY